MGKRRSVAIRAIALVVVSAPAAGVFWSAQAPAWAADAPAKYASIGPGLTYSHERQGDVPWSIHVLKIARSRGDLKIVTPLAGGRVVGVEPVNRMTSWAPVVRSAGTAVAAINGDFFQISGNYVADPEGVQIVAGDLVSDDGADSICFWLDGDGNPHLADVDVALRVTWPDGVETSVGLNERRPDDGAVLYTPTFAESTRTIGGYDLALERVDDGPWLPLAVGQTYTGRVRLVNLRGNTQLASTKGWGLESKGVMALSVGPELAEKLKPVEAGALVKISVQSTPDLTGVQTAISGQPLLIVAGKMVPNLIRLDDKRHPRSAIGWNDTHIFLVVVDGRKPGLWVGMNMQEIGELMQRLGCTDAMNLDGGGSSTMWLDGQIMNCPSDGSPRPVGNALVVARKPKPEPEPAPVAE